MPPTPPSPRLAVLLTLGGLGAFLLACRASTPPPPEDPPLRSQLSGIGIGDQFHVSGCSGDALQEPSNDPPFESNALGGATGTVDQACALISAGTGCGS